MFWTPPESSSLSGSTAASNPATVGSIGRGYFEGFALLYSLIAYDGIEFFVMFYALMAEEEPVDQKKYFEDLCKPKCVRAWLEYQGCVKRVEADESGHKHCTGQYFDYWHCVDKCVAPKLFKKLK
ncbi:hypothetical protein L6452_01404 [Arctium lappa]|uniref:Uncharacterized protein n=1 Tax=Arctium lappa TaxID=4217 RepID=A0ACB9FI18_ARCLA|nr:hypothetical protein L6452_01404 [Arctium lappa]